MDCSSNQADMALGTIREALHYAHQGGRLSRLVLGLDWVEEAARRCGPAAVCAARMQICVIVVDSWLKAPVEGGRQCSAAGEGKAAIPTRTLLVCALQVASDAPSERRAGQCQHAP